MRNTYKDFYRPVNPSKYNGDPSKIVFRSSWERVFMKWCDHNPDVEFWSSEELVVPYICKTDGRQHRYFPDFIVKFKTGKVVMIEIKPKSQCMPPKPGKRKSQETMLTEVMTYEKNMSKWSAAEEFCKRKGWSFAVFTEDTLKTMGMKFPGPRIRK